MPVHTDINDDFPHRDWATLIYLSDLPEGEGATHFPNRGGLRIEPRAGRMLTCPCGTEPHGVEAAGEDRYTLICWWSVNPQQGAPS